MTALTLDLPLPPSVNALYRNAPGRGRVKTGAYNAWLEEAGWAAVTRWRAAGRPSFTAPLALTIELGLSGRRRDAGNTLKPIEDLLVKRIPQLPDDRHNDLITIRRGVDVPAGIARVTITSLPGEPPG